MSFEEKIQDFPVPRSVEFQFDGGKYSLAPLQLRQLRGPLKDDIARLTAAPAAVASNEEDLQDALLNLAHASLKRNYPAVERDELLDQLTGASVAPLIITLLELSGFVFGGQVKAQLLPQTGGDSTGE